MLQANYTHFVTLWIHEESQEKCLWKYLIQYYNGYIFNEHSNRYIENTGSRVQARPPGPKGPQGVGFNLTASRDYDMKTRKFTLILGHIFGYGYLFRPERVIIMEVI